MGQVVEDEGKYHEEKQKPKDISLTPSMWIIWYEIFDNIFSEMAKIKGVSNGVNQVVHL
jgi:hypothetical protein